ncbi:MAG TPA: DUF2079 domain-containing protein [Trebonia sp.]|nr:DUF2079 domain-containing protein [Trebonia sp.]
MTEVNATIVIGAHAKARTTVTPLHRMRRIGYAVLGVQFACFIAWSTLLYQRYALTWDFATYNQPWYLIAHGDLSPYSTVSRLPFWQNDAEFMPWVLAPLYWLVRNDVLLPWLQDASIVGAEVIAFTWLCELAKRHCQGRDAAWLAGLGLLLLVANPWLWWTISFDVHEEALVIFFTACLAWDLSRGRRRAWVWVLPVLLGGAPSATYVIGIGLGAMLTRRRIRDMGAAIAAVGLVYSVLLVATHADAGVPLARHYGYLVTGSTLAPVGFTSMDLFKGIASHPSAVIATLWDKRSDVMANLAPGGIVGVGSLMILPLMVVVLLANVLSAGYRFSEPLFQSLPIYVLLPVGTTAVVGWLLTRRRRTSFALAGLIAVQALGWTVVWGSHTPSQWLRIPAAEAATLASVQADVSPEAEVVASQGVMGRFSSRLKIYGLSAPNSTVPVAAGTWFIVTPTTGIETLPPGPSLRLIGDLAGPLHATLVTHANGVWAFRYSPPPGVSHVHVPDGDHPLPAWAAAGAAGLPVLAGQVGDWHMAATGAQGYVSDGLEWLEPPGPYQAAVTLSAAGPVNVEVWDDTTGALLARRSITGTSGTQRVVMPVAAPHAPNAVDYAGWGPFHADFALPPLGQNLEVRVWSPGGEAVDVYSADLTAVAGG